MDKLPNELLIKIFNDLSVLELSNLAKVHQRFLEIIQSTPSLRNYDITLDKKRGKTISTKCRRIGRLKVINYTPRIHQNILTTFGYNISNITFSDSDISYPKIAHILRLCPKARSIKFENVSVWPEVTRQLPTELESIVELTNSSACILDLFTKSKLGALRITQSFEEYGIGIRGFLKTQPTLKSLYLRGSKVLDFFYSMGNSSCENHEPLPFKLRLLILHDINWKSHYIDLFLPMIHTLNLVELVGIVPLESHRALEQLINNCTNLDQLRCDGCVFKFINSQSITNMTMKNSITDGLNNNIPNLKTLRWINQQQCPNSLNLGANVKLEELFIINSGLHQWPLNIPSVKKLVLENLTSLSSDENNKFITIYNVVEELDISNCEEFMEQILVEVASKMNNLKVLELKGERLSTEVKNKIKMRCINLKELTFNGVNI